VDTPTRRGKKNRPRGSKAKERDSESPKPRQARGSVQPPPKKKKKTNRRLRPKETEPELPPEPKGPSLGKRLWTGRSALWERAKRPLKILGKTILAAVLLAGCVAVGRLGRDYVRTSEAFALKELSADGFERITEAEVLETAGLALGQNVFDVAPEAAVSALESHPWIATATVERRLPGTMRVTVTERRAAAILALDAELYLVGDDGTLFKAFEPGDPVDLPVVTGVRRDRFVADRPYRTSVLLEVVALMHDYRAAGLWRREPIGEMHVGRDDAITLHVGEDGMEVRLGRGPFRQKLRKLRRVLDRLDERESRALYVYLDNVRRPDRVTVRLRQEPAPADT